jgi:cytochrome d ubiquinol oxidase subunit I
MLSLLTTHSLTGTVPGLNAYAIGDVPSLVDDTFVFYSFRAMVAIGVALFLLMLIGITYWWRGMLTIEAISEHRLFWRIWVLAIPLGFIATEAGWITREVGRQPWIVYHIMRVGDGLSNNLTTASVGTTLALFTFIYLGFSALFIYFTWKILRTGPDFTSTAPLL